MKEKQINNEFEIKVIQSLIDCRKIIDDWNNLLTRTTSTNIYSDPDFFISMFNFRSDNSEPHIVLFYLENKLKGMIIGWKNKTKKKYNIGYLKFKSPFLDQLNIEIGGIIVDGDKTTNIEILKYLSYQISSKEIDLLQISHIQFSHPTYHSLINSKISGVEPIYTKSVNWVAKIRNDKTGEKIEYNSPKTLSGIRRRERKLLKYFNNDLNILDFSNLNESEFFISAADKISRQSYQYAINVGIKNTKVWHNIVTILAQKKFLAAYLLIHKEQPISYIFGFKFKDIFYLYATSYDNNYNKYSPGEYLRNKVIDILIGEGINFIDFGFGDADYKRLYGTEGKEEATLNFYGFSIRAKLAKSFDIISLKINSVILQFLNRLGILNLIKKKFRNLMSKKRVG